LNINKINLKGKNMDIENKLNLVENTPTPEDPNVAGTDNNLIPDQLFQQTLLPSLGRQIFSVIPTIGPTGAIFNLRNKVGTNDFELVRSNSAVYPSESIKTGMTQEVIQDIKSQYGKNAGPIIGKLLRGLANDQENTRTLQFLDANCLAMPGLTLTTAKNPELNMFEIIQVVTALVLRANSKTLRTYKAFCVLPYEFGASVMGLNAYVTSGDEKDQDGLFLAQVGKLRFYMNPNATSTMAYVGLKDPANPNKSSAIFSPYLSNVITAIDPNSGQQTNHIYNRFAITASPLHELGNEMLFKFNILK